MFSLFKNIFNASKIDASAITDKDEHENIENPEIIVQSTAAIKNLNSDETMQVVMAKENILAELVLENLNDVNHTEFKTNPCIILTDCMSEFIRLKESTPKPKACLSDGKRIQRNCAKVAATRISKICWQLDETQARSLDFDRSQHKRLCAKVAETKISEMFDMTSPESDADVESEMSMSETEMSEAEMSESD